jgi:AP-4 complex subunit epsilon-1
MLADLNSDLLHYSQEHQLAVVDCLEDPDDTLKLKTLELLYKMTKANNVEVITERMMGYLRTTTDEHIRRDIARKVRAAHCCLL